MLSKNMVLTIFIAAFLIMLAGEISAESLTITPSEIVQGKSAMIEIDSEVYGPYIYFYRANRFVTSTRACSAGNISCFLSKSCQCFGPKSANYTFKTSIFGPGEYRANVYSQSENKWLETNFTITELLCTGGAKANQCAVIKPGYCNAAGELVQDCEKCGCNQNELCQTNGRCIKTCSDSTLAGKCSSSGIGSYCNAEGKLTDNCSLCGCASGEKCKADGSCTVTLPLPVINIKAPRYSSKEVFIASDKDWKEVLPFVSATVWKKLLSVEKHPLLIYHEEDSGFDADSIVYFLQDYGPSSISLIGAQNSKLRDLLSQHTGKSILPVSSQDYLFYWLGFNKVVYVEDNYELALLASTYASLLNAPLIIKGTRWDIPEVFKSRRTICVGDVSPGGSSCDEKYNLEQLQQKYFDETGTNKIILVNPDDWYYAVNENFETEESKIGRLYAKTSLAAPLLASAKKELILNTRERNYQEIDKFVEEKIRQFNAEYLTIIASDIIPYKRETEDVKKLLDYLEYDFGIAIDPHDYADITGDHLPDVAVGRIAGISNSDVSSYIARALFYYNADRADSIKFLGSAFSGILARTVKVISAKFQESGYNSVAVTSDEELYEFNPREWENQDMILYTGHGSDNWAGILYWEIPKLKNSLVLTPTCATIEKFDGHSFWAFAIRKGAIGYVGAVTETFLTTSGFTFLNKVYYSNQNLGNAFKNSYSYSLTQAMLIFIGDPTLNSYSPKRLNEEIPDTVVEIGESLLCENTQTSCGLQPDCVSCAAFPAEDLRCNVWGTKLLGKKHTCISNFIGCIKAPLEAEIESCSYGCTESGGAHCKAYGEDNSQSCALDAECTTGQCNYFQCGFQQNGEACVLDNDCTNNHCGGGVCGGLPDGSLCISNYACTNGVCTAGTCGSLLPDGASCPSGLGAACASGYCLQFRCGLRYVGELCFGNHECFSGKCRWLTCRA
jgi:hypothetical protein